MPIVVSHMTLSFLPQTLTAQLRDRDVLFWHIAIDLVTMTAGLLAVSIVFLYAYCIAARVLAVSSNNTPRLQTLSSPCYQSV